MLKMLFASFFLLSSSAALAAPCNSASCSKAVELQYVGGFTICAGNPAKMAEWYRRFGIETTYDAESQSYFGGFKWKGVDFNFAIIDGAYGAPYCKVASSGYGLTFRVSDFKEYLAKLARAGLIPFERQETPKGSFALFRDPDGNLASIWGAASK